MTTPRISRISTSRRPTVTYSRLLLTTATALMLVGCQSTGKKPSADATNSMPSTQTQAGSASPVTATSNTRRPGRMRGTPIDPALAAAARERAFIEIERAGQDSDPQLRSNAVEASRLAPKRLSALTRTGVRDANPGVRTTALMVAGWTVRRDLAADVDAAINDASPYVRAAAIFASVKLGRAVDQTPLGNLVLSDPSSRVRAHAAVVLGEIGNPSALGLLKRAARQRSPQATDQEARSLQLQLAEAMVRLGDTQQVDVIRAALYPSRPEDLEAAALAAQIIGVVKDRNAEPNLKILVDLKDPGGNKMPAEVRLACAASLLQLGIAEAATVAYEHLNSDRPAVRAQLAFTLGHSRWNESFVELQRLLDDPEPMVRVAAAAGVLRAAGPERR
jgi:HEAT repeat protein